MPGTMELAKRLKVTPRTIRTYLKERREMLSGPEMYWLHLYAENEPVGPPELLAIEECAKRTGLSVREIRRKIWEERRDRIAKIREQFGAGPKAPNEAKLR
jgi:predicted transcriptional regulator